MRNLTNEFTQINAYFLSEKTGATNTINGLIGGRRYLIPPEKSTRFYVNALLGETTPMILAVTWAFRAEHS